ncbi:MAG TPA: diguanylate cyclase [Micromonosporaceae bacterium]
MTLRARLTGAFFAVVMGPVLVGGLFVGFTVDAVNHSRERDRLNLAVTTIRTDVAATCDRLAATAEAAATVTVAGTQPANAQALVTQGRASAIQIQNTDGAPLVTTAGAPSSPWAMCAPLPAASGVPAYDPSVDGPYTALAAVAVIRNQQGGLVGYAYAVQTLSPAFVASIGAGTGVQVTVMSVRSAVASTQSATAAGHIADYAASLAAGHIGSDRGRYVRRVDATAGQPFTIAVSLPVTPSGDLFAIVMAVVAFATIAAVAGAWVLARTTTRPLDEIADAADRIADGDLETRVPIRHDDEVGHLGAAFNRLSREMQAYSTALTNSRDQLRGNLDIIGDTLASTHDLPRILHVILASAISATSAQAGVLLLTDPADGLLRLQCSEGFDADALAVMRGFELAPGEGVLGTVAASGVALRGRVPSSGPGPMPAPHEPSCRSYLAVALRSPAASPALAATSAGVGVLALYDRLGEDEFDDMDLRTVRSFASHAAVAVDNVRAHAEAQRLSHTDPLTGLYNYRHLKDLLGHEVNRSIRFGHPLCVMVLDLDRFKEVNDGYGHAAGDAVLIEFARRIGVEIRGVDRAFRYGGEEFVLLLPETDGIGGITLAQRLGAAVRESTFTIPGGRDEAGVRAGATVDAPIAVTVSIGVAVFPIHGADGTQILEAADDALYAAKAAGRDTYRLATSRVAATGPETPAMRVPRDSVASVPDDDPVGGDGVHPDDHLRPVGDLAAAGVSDPVGSAGPVGSGGISRWRGWGAGRGGDRSPGGASIGTPTPRQTRGR